MYQENDDKNYDEYEIDLREYILLIWKKKFLLVGLVVAAMLAAFVLTGVMSDPEYEASSTLLIMPPMYTTSIEMGSLPIDTYRELAMTPQMRNKIIAELDLRNEEGEELTSSALENKIDFEIAGRNQMERGEEQIEVPLIRLKAIYPESEVAAEIANMWAELFMEDTREIRRAEISEISTVIENRFETTRERLNEAREELKDFYAESRLGPLKVNLAALNTQIEEAVANRVTLDYEIAVLESELSKNNELLSNAIYEEGWMGGLSREVLDENLPRSIRYYVNSRNNLLEHKNNYNIELLKQEVARLENRILRYKDKIEQNEVLLEANMQQLEEIESLLLDQEHFWKLERSLSDELNWQNLFNPSQLEIITSITLTEDMVNPIYESLIKQQQEIWIENARLRSEIKTLNESFNFAEAELVELKGELVNEIEKRERLESDVDTYRGLYELEVEYYQDLNREIKEAELELARRTEELLVVEKEQERLSDQIAKLDNEVREYEIEENDLIQEIEDYQASYQQLASRAEEARLAQAEQTSDVKFVSNAIAPEKATVGVGNKLLNMAIAAVLAGMLGVFGIFFAEFLKEE